MNLDLSEIRARCEAATQVVHELKCWSEYYDAVEREDKPFEIRKWDRPYKVGDILHLRRWDPKTADYTGEEMRRTITYLLDMTYLPGDNIPHFAGYVAIGLGNPALLDEVERLTARAEAAEARTEAAIADYLKAAGPYCDTCLHSGDEKIPTVLCNHCMRARTVDNFPIYPHWEYRIPKWSDEQQKEEK